MYKRQFHGSAQFRGGIPAPADQPVFHGEGYTHGAENAGGNQGGEEAAAV